MTESTYKSLQRAHPHSSECRFTKPCHFRVAMRNGRKMCVCLSDCGFREEYEDCPFRLTDAEVERNIEAYPFDPNYAEVHQ